jgi:very-short-patch-repair endonuclease
VDFAARRERLAIELDGETHSGRETYDERRTAYIERAGWTVIRFTNRDMLANPEGVAITILAALHRPGRSKKGELS